MAQTIILNMNPKGIPDAVYVSQYDVGRELVFKLYEGVSVYTIPADVTAVIGGKKSDGHVFAYNATISQDRHSISVETTEQMTACKGDNLCQLRISKSGIDIATVNFRMIVQERPDADGDPSETDIPVLVELAQEQAYDSEAWAKGTKDGTPVSSDDPQYNNNAKYWADQAAQSVTGVASFNGRQGAVLPATNDYDATQIKFGTNSNVNTELGNKQNKTLDTAITIGGTSRTTVEAALGALNDAKADNTDFITKLCTALSTEWSSIVDSDGYYTNIVSLGASINPTAFRPIIGVCGSTFNTKETSAEAAAYNLCDMFSFADSTSVSSVTIKAKTKPTETFYFTVSGFNV